MLGWVAIRADVVHGALSVAVKHGIPIEPASQEDEAVVSMQLGRKPKGVIGVVQRCPDGYPQVVVTHPLPQAVDGSPDGSACGVGGAKGTQDGQVFPTLFWLTCPMLVRAIGRLEAAGWIRRIGEELQADPQAAVELAAAHVASARIRRDLVAGCMEGVRLRDAERDVLERSGVAGTREGGQTASGVKCLHAHYADYLARGENPVGRRVALLLEEAGVQLSGDETCSASCRPYWSFKER